MRPSFLFMAFFFLFGLWPGAAPAMAAEDDEIEVLTLAQRNLFSAESFLSGDFSSVLKRNLMLYRRAAESDPSDRVAAEGLARSLRFLSLWAAGP